MIYLDNSATTPLAPEVIVRMDAWRAANYANASSVHYGGQRARVELEDARARIAQILGAEPKEIVITSGGTEANNFAIKGYAFKAYRLHGSWPAILIPRTEHHAVLHPSTFLAELGLPLFYLDVDTSGRVTPDALQAGLSRIPRQVKPLVSIMHGNNETGALNPIADLAAVAHQGGAIFHTDAVQTFGKLPFTAEALQADMISISAHKIHGPKGIGALYISKEIELEPLIHGGSQERNRRGGTESVELATGFSEAASLAESRMEQSRSEIERSKRLLRSLLVEIDGIRFVSPDDNVLPNIITVTFTDAAQLDGEGLIVGMDLEGVAVSNGSACTSGSIQPSHVLTAIGLPPEQAKAAVRFSLSCYTTEEEITYAVEALKQVLERMRSGERPIV